MVEGADSILEEVELDSIGCCNGVDENDGERGKRGIEQDPICSVNVQSSLFSHMDSSLTSSHIRLAVAQIGSGIARNNASDSRVRGVRLRSIED